MIRPMTDEERQRAKERAMTNKERSSEAADWRSQSDEVQAAVAAALREADEAVQSVASNCTTEDGHVAIIAAVEKVRSLITPDAQAALNRYVKERSDEVVAAEREECVGAVRAFFGNLYDEDEWTMEELVAAIRKGGE